LRKLDGFVVEAREYMACQGKRSLYGYKKNPREKVTKF
jgi:hypothetical protein